MNNKNNSKKIKNKKLGPVEFHPYGMFIPQNAKSIIVGSFPIAKFTGNRDNLILKPSEIDFSYGGEKSYLWTLLSTCFEVELSNKDQITNFLKRKGIAIGDVIISCKRIDNSSSDNHLRERTYCPNLSNAISKNGIKTIFFTSSKVESWFHSKIGKIKGTKEVLLISPSGSGVRQLPERFKSDLEKWRQKNPNKKLIEFRSFMYEKVFTQENFPDLN